jgi:hypothetical protein
VHAAAAVVQYMDDTYLTVHCDCCSLQLNWHHCQILEENLVPGRGYLKIIFTLPKANQS